MEQMRKKNYRSMGKVIFKSHLTQDERTTIEFYAKQEKTVSHNTKLMEPWSILIKYKTIDTPKMI